MDQQDHDQIDEDTTDQRRQQRRPFPVKYLAPITKLMTNVFVDEAAVAADQNATDDDDQEEEEPEEYLKKLELLVKQCLIELEEERRRQPHRSIISDGASTSNTTTDHGDTTGRWNGAVQKQVLDPADNEIVLLGDARQKKEIQRAFVCFPNSLILPSKRSYRVSNWPEGLVFCNVVDDLDTICFEAAKSFLFEGVVQHQINQITSYFINLRNDLRDAYTQRPSVVIKWLQVLTDAAIYTKNFISDLIVKMAAHGGSKKLITKGKLYPLNKFLVLLSFIKDEDYSKARQEPFEKLNSFIHNDILWVMHYVKTSLHPATWRPPITFRADDDHLGHDHNHISGREEDIEILIQKHLMSKEKRVQLISVVGMLGTGKTALVHQIYSQYNVVCRFDVFAWAQSEGGGASQNICFLTDTWSNILRNAVRENKVTDVEMHQMKREMDDRIITTGGEIAWNQHDDRIFDILRNHRYLIIIDDITTTEVWDEVRKALPMDTMNGSRILLTTRDTRVALHAIHYQEGSPPPHQLGPLSDGESWELFTMKVCNPSPLPLDLVSIGKEIVKKCDGLPFAIKHLADYLSTQETTYDAWFNVLQTADKQPNNYHTPWSNILNMIVKDLSLNLKWCLFYFGLFPKKISIPVRRLIALWVAEGFVEQRNEKTLECIAEEYLQELIHLNMVQVTKHKSNGRPKKCCLTNYLREHLWIRGNQTYFASSTSESSTSTSTKLWVRRLADHPEVNTLAMPSFSDSYRLLLSFLSFDYREGYEPGERIRSFLYGGTSKGHFEFLRVLDLEGVYKPGLPKEMRKLIHLMYLGLRWTYLDSFPSFIGNLINLQTLDVKHTYISTLPGSIWRLRKLRHVYLNECYLDSFVHQPDAGYLENLQTLWGIHVDEESSVVEGLDRFTKITRLGVSCHLTSKSQQDAMAKWISKLELLQSLRVRSKDRLGKLSVVHLLPFTTHVHLSDLYFHGQLEKLFEVNAFPPNLTELTLSASKLKKDPMPTLEKLPCLRILRLYCDSYTGEHMVCSPLGFIRLEVLQIWKLENVTIWSVEENSMPMLKKLEIRSCNNLERLPGGLQQITTLQELKLTDMPLKFIDEVKKDKDKGCYKKVNVCFVDLEDLL